MSRAETYRRIEEVGIVPIVRTKSADLATRAADAVFAGGIPVLEITLTVPGAPAPRDPRSAVDRPTGSDRRTDSDRWRSAYVGALLAGLVVLQIGAEIAQVQGGFRPFAHAPSRVAYSWDMFAIRLDRCAVRWDPPLSIDGHSVHSWSDRVWPIEFDSVYNDVGRYEHVARAACAYKSEPATRVSLQCYLGDGGIEDHGFDCP